MPGRGKGRRVCGLRMEGGQSEPRWGLWGQSSLTAPGLCAKAGRQGSWTGVVRRGALPPQAHPKGPAKNPGEDESMTEHDGLFILAPKRKSFFQQISKSGLVSGHTEKQSVISKLGTEREGSGERAPFVLAR